MKVRMDQLLDSIGMALEMVEQELLGVSENHGKRIAILTIKMAEHLGFSEQQISATAASALLHDSALTEYMLLQQPNPKEKINFKHHCKYGQRNIDYLPFESDIDGFVLYHHERPDGSGPFGLTEDEIPLGAALVAIADSLDYEFDFRSFSSDRVPWLRKLVADRAGTFYTHETARVFLHIFDQALLKALRDDRVADTYASLMPCWFVRLTDESLVNLAHLTAHIIDQKSVFTRHHSVHLAKTAWRMGLYYNLDETETHQLYLGSALHDLGKLWIPTDILEKPGLLTKKEFDIIKQHVAFTHNALSNVTGLEEILEFTVKHHEKLDGSGYHRGLHADDLDFKARLLACADIYQAVSEKRPYHPARDHDETIAIMNTMVDKGLIDGDIVRDFDHILRHDITPEQKPPCFRKASAFVSESAH